MRPNYLSSEARLPGAVSLFLGHLIPFFDAKWNCTGRNAVALVASRRVCAVLPAARGELLSLRPAWYRKVDVVARTLPRGAVCRSHRSGEHALLWCGAGTVATHHSGESRQAAGRDRRGTARAGIAAGRASAHRTRQAPALRAHRLQCPPTAPQRCGPAGGARAAHHHASVHGGRTGRRLQPESRSRAGADTAGRRRARPGCRVALIRCAVRA